MSSGQSIHVAESRRARGSVYGDVDKEDEGDIREGENRRRGATVLSSPGSQRQEGVKQGILVSLQTAAQPLDQRMRNSQFLPHIPNNLLGL